MFVIYNVFYNFKNDFAISGLGINPLEPVTLASASNNAIPTRVH